MSDKSIFLPFFYNNTGLNLLTLQTFGQPVRYFHSPTDPLLAMFKKAAADKYIPVSAGEVVVGERDFWNVEYIITRLYNNLYMNDYPAYSALKIDTIEDIFKQEMPAELQLAILKVVTKELLSDDNS